MKIFTLPKRLAGLMCILLVLLAASASGQAYYLRAAAQVVAPEFSSLAEFAQSKVTDWIVLLDGMPVSAFRLQLADGKTNLDETQKNQVRAYNRLLATEQYRFIDTAQKQGVPLTVQRSFRYLINGLVVSVSSAEIENLAEVPGVRGIYPDSQVHLELADSVTLIGADQVWQLQDANGQAVTGQGMRVAVIDTGIEYTHPDLGGCFGPGCKVEGGYDLYNNDANPMDDNGHGTHCAGIVAADGTLKGVAPGASLYAYKVLNAFGSGTELVIIAGIERAADPDQDPATADAVDVISMSLGLPGTPDDPWPMAVDAAVDQGIVIVVSAGNSGPEYASVESPGVARLATAVGASDKSDMIASFSSHGPIPGYDGWLKPNLLAPGVDILSTYLGGTYASSSGTSMATPHVAGAAALVKQMRPTWTPEQIQASLMNTAIDLGLDVHTQGAGRLQVDRAVAVPGLVTPSSISFGTVDVSQPLWSDTRLLSLENVTGSARTYSLSVETRLPDGVTARVEPNAMTLAVGEKRSFSIALSVDTHQTPPDLERNEGLIHVQQGEVVLEVPFAFLIPPLFSESSILPFGLQTSYAVVLADLDGDGDLDAFVGNTSYYDNPADTVWFNDGAGNFTDSGQRLGSAFTWDVALGDLDGDGDLDAFIANSDLDSPEPDEVWINNGHGYFSDSGQRLGGTLSRAVALGDFDQDGDLDAFVVNGISERGRAEADTVWLNNGQGVFNNSGQALGSSSGLDVALGDVDGDGDLDAFVANGDSQRMRSEPNEVWLNNGSGTFNNSGQSLGNALSQAVTLGDLDGDSDLDAFVANGGPAILDGQPDEVWLNNGSGLFVSNGQSLGNQSSYGAAMADLHQDGTLDVFVAGYNGGNRVWLNDGSGHLTLSSPGFGIESAADVALGDVDEDGDIDALVANAISKPNRLWLNRSGGGPALDHLTPPSGLTAVDLSATSINLFWADNAGDETGYRVERSLDGTSGWMQIAALPANTNIFTDTGLTCATQYFYRVHAYRSGDNAYSSYSNVANATTQPCALPAPTGLSATAVSTSQVDLSWTDNAGDETAYRVERSLDGTTGWNLIVSLPANTTTYSNTALSCAENYYYRVQAYRSFDQTNSLYSNLANAITDQCKLTSPTNLSASMVSCSRIDLAWIDNSADETGYRVERSLNGINGWVEIIVLPENITVYSDTGLACSTEFYFRVRAYRESDEQYSPYSNTAKAETDLCMFRVYLPIIIMNFP